ncbi:hypothetical protein C8F01DRAFT_1266590 [Mycena amicta]|nr:hypothetical protein C8F01DRAFT_1266590 [Mycena amicta]
MPPRRAFSTVRFLCDICGKGCLSTGGLQKHRNSHPTLPKAPTAAAAVSPTPPPPSRSPSPHGGFEEFLSSARPSLSPSPDPHQFRPERQTTPEARRAVRTEHHPILDGTPCDADGYNLPPGALPPPLDERAADDFGAFDDRAQFEFAEFLYKRQEMSGDSIDELAQLLAALYQDDPFFNNHRDLYTMIDSIQQGDIPWQSFAVEYTGPRPETGEIPSWMTEKYEVWFRCPLAIFERQLANPDFKDELDWAPKRVYKDGKRQFTDLFSGNWVWEQADIIAEEETNHVTRLPSVATGDTEFWPLYGGIGNTYNATRRAHRDGIALLAFLAIPKTTRQYAKRDDFRKFRRQLFHSSIRQILDSVKPHMSTPRVTRCADGHFRRAIYELGPDIADYPEQALITCIVQGYCPICLSPPDDLDCKSPPRTCEHRESLLEVFMLKQAWDDYSVVGDITPFTSDLPRADIHKLIAVDLLHQIIKGAFKDHIVDWVEAYIKEIHEPAEADRILADIDRRIAVAAPFPGLRRFPVGRGFKQWTGNDSKGLMKVYIPAIVGHVPNEIVQAVSALVEFC